MKLNVNHWKRCFKWNVLNWMHIKYNLNDSSINAQSISICTFRRNRIEEKKSEKSYQSPKLRYGRVDRMKNSCDALADNAVLCLETDWWQRFFFCVNWHEMKRRTYASISTSCQWVLFGISCLVAIFFCLRYVHFSRLVDILCWYSTCLAISCESSLSWSAIYPFQ